MQAHLIQMAVLLGWCAQLCAAAASSARVSKAARAAVSSEGSVIPDWRLEAMDSDATLAPNLLAHTQPASLGAAPAAPERGAGVALLDEQRCHRLKLPANVQVVAQELTWRSLTGAWYGQDSIRLATWQRNHFRTDRAAMFISSEVEQALALEEASSKTDEEMSSEYGWTAAGAPEPGLNLPMLDCDRHLLCVVRMRETAFHDVDIYGPDGSLLANTLIDHEFERIQFVDGNGFLIATAEAPAMNRSLPRARLNEGADPTKAHVLPYEIHFEAGGYTNASQLLSTEYRWAVAAAVQSRAVLFAPIPAHGLLNHDEPHMPWWYVALQVFGIVAVVGLVAGVLFGVYRVVYPAILERATFSHGYMRKPAQMPAVKRMASFLERQPMPYTAATPPSPATAYLIRD